MKKVGRIGILAVAVGILSAVNMTAFTARASESAVLEQSRKGSITVDVRSADTGEAIPGGVLTLYMAASAEQTQEGVRFELTEAFKESKADLSGIRESDAGAKELAAELERFADGKALPGQSVTVDENGQAVWKELELGVYLIVNTAPADGYEPLTSFLATVPRYLNGAYVYDIQAKPKPERAHPDSPDRSDPSSGTPSGNTVNTVNTVNTGDVLPRTGQLWWPVPVLALAGMLLVLLGWHERRRYD